MWYKREISLSIPYLKRLKIQQIKQKSSLYQPKSILFIIKMKKKTKLNFIFKGTEACLYTFAILGHAKLNQIFIQGGDSELN